MRACLPKWLPNRAALARRDRRWPVMLNTAAALAHGALLGFWLGHDAPPPLLIGVAAGGLALAACALGWLAYWEYDGLWFVLHADSIDDVATYLLMHVMPDMPTDVLGGQLRVVFSQPIVLPADDDDDTDALRGDLDDDQVATLLDLARANDETTFRELGRSLGVTGARLHALWTGVRARLRHDKRRPTDQP